MSDATIVQKYVLVGQHAGRTMSVNGHEFEAGEFTFIGSAAQAATLTQIFSFYGVKPAELAELDELRANTEPDADADDDNKGPKVPTRDELDAALSALPGDYVDPDFVVNGMRAHFGDLFTEADELKVRELVKAGPAPKPTLGEAIGLLDPESDAHWTSNNLPSLDVLSDLTGTKVARADVDGVADGYTRAKARQLRSGN